jgi:hypothetical protein
VDSLRRRALAGIEAITDRRLQGTTDIWGSLGAASEVEIHDSVDARVIIVTGDGKDTRKDPLPITLTGIDFVFQLAPGAQDSTSALYTRRDAWSKALLARGAASVTFLAPGELVTLDALRSRASGANSP